MSKTYLEGAVHVATFCGPEMPFRNTRRFVQITTSTTLGYAAFHVDELPAVIAALEQIQMEERPR